jgi:hypothetical protein
MAERYNTACRDNKAQSPRPSTFVPHKARENISWELDSDKASLFNGGSASFRPISLTGKTHNTQKYNHQKNITQDDILSGSNLQSTSAASPLMSKLSIKAKSITILGGSVPGPHRIASSVRWLKLTQLVKRAHYDPLAI